MVKLIPVVLTIPISMKLILHNKHSNLEDKYSGK